MQLKVFFDENDIINPTIVGDLNIRIGNLQQDISDQYWQSLKARRDIKISNDMNCNNKDRQFMKFCADENLFLTVKQKEMKKDH